MKHRHSIHTVNVRGTDEFSVHVVRDGKPSIDAVFCTADKATNRQNALEHARDLARNLGCKVGMHHGVVRERLAEFLTKER